jgi:hypothetical protein
MPNPYNADEGFLGAGDEFWYSVDDPDPPFSGSQPIEITGVTLLGRVMSWDWGGPKTNTVALKTPVNATTARILKKGGRVDGQTLTLNCLFEPGKYADLLALTGQRVWITIRGNDGPDDTDPATGASVTMVRGVLQGPSLKNDGREEQKMSTITIDVDHYSFIEPNYA